jgi:hypothetical protein
MTYLVSNDWFSEVAAGRVAGWSIIHKFGRNAAVGTTEETIWATGGSYVWRETAGKVKLTSTNSVDGTNGAGVRSMTIQRLDASFAAQSEEISLAGTVASKSANDYIRVHRAFASGTGTYGQSNSGTVSCAWSVSPTTAFTINPGVGQTEVAFYTIPAGTEAFLYSAHIYVKPEVASSACNVKLYQIPGTDDITAPTAAAKRRVLNLDGLVSDTLFKPTTPLWFNEKTDLFWTGTRVGNTDMEVAISFELLLHTL